MLPNRRPCETVTVGPFDISIGYHPETGQVCETFVSGRGKSGHEMDQHLAQMGVLFSKAIQGEDIEALDLDNLLGEKDRWTDQLG